QGTALVGLLDAFWESKGYVRPDEFKEFCNTTVPLARLPQRIYTTAEKLSVDIELAHFGAEPMKETKAVWLIGSKLLGETETRTFPIGKNIPLGHLSIAASRVGPGQQRLTVIFAPSAFFDTTFDTTGKIRPSPAAIPGTTYFENHWDFWVYTTNVPD